MQHTHNPISISELQQWNLDKSQNKENAFLAYGKLASTATSAHKKVAKEPPACFISWKMIDVPDFLLFVMFLQEDGDHS